MFANKLSIWPHHVAGISARRNDHPWIGRDAVLTVSKAHVTEKITGKTARMQTSIEKRKGRHLFLSGSVGVSGYAGS